MKKFAIMGLGTFGIRMLEELSEIGAETVIIDQNKEVLDKYKTKAKTAYVLEEISETSLRKFIPSQTDTVIVDFTRKIELSIISTTFLKNIGIKNIVARAQSDEHGRLLKNAGATKIIYPDSEAAKRTTPILASELLLKFMPISKDLTLAEVGVAKKYVGKSLIEANLRHELGINIIARRKTATEEFIFMDDPDYQFEEDDVLLIVASEDNIYAFTEGRVKNKTGIASSVLKNLFSKKH